jgi:hypothetical protein
MIFLQAALVLCGVALMVKGDLLIGLALIFIGVFADRALR